MGKILVILFLLLVFYCSFLKASEEGLVAYWNFDDLEGVKITEAVSGGQDKVLGNFKHIKGIKGKGLKFDGFTTRIVRRAKEAPVMNTAYTVEAWVAPQAYPWNWCAVVNQEYEHQRGFFFGIDAEGRVGLHMAISRQWRQCISEQTIPFMEWSHVAATFDPQEGMKVYINGQLAGQISIKGTLLVDIDMDLEIGRNHKKIAPSSLNRAGRVRTVASYSFDGIIDELKIYKRCLGALEIEKNYQSLKSNSKPVLTWRKLPQLPPGPRRFGAFYTKLKYDEDWDVLWRVDDHPDLVVTFDDEDYAMIFWRGTNYNMNLVTEKGQWIADQSVETYGPTGCFEHMSDKQNRYSHVRLIENHPARVVVHWRYALTDVLYNIANVDPITDWGDWADEYYYIYPDGVAIRHFAIHGTEDGYSITEPAALSNPGEKPEDNVELEAVTLADMQGQVHSFSYETWPSNFRSGANISIVNFKSEFKPFYIYEPGTNIGPYGGGIREIDYTYSHFHSRNHWPVAMVPSDGRFVLAADRVTSSAITSPGPPMKRREKDNALEGRFIMGLSDQKIETLVTLAHSWLQPTDLMNISPGFNNEGYDINERAYILSKKTDEASVLNFKVLADNNSPLINPCFIIKNWGEENASFEINNQKLKTRMGKRRTLQGSDLIIWVPYKTEEPVSISIKKM